MNEAGRIAPLLRALGGACVRLLAIAAPAYILITAATFLWGREEILVWTLKVSTFFIYVSLPFFFIARIRFGRALRKSDPQLAERLGLFGHLELDGAKTLTASGAMLGFLLRRDYRSLPDPVLRRLATWYAVVNGVGIVFAAAMFGSVLVIISAGLGLFSEH